ncbi:hypothetical protein EUA06_18315 [Nocardioides glacieisoli]|uniref:Double-GTPase 1 domain-containing protein n=1 Tax=Nocardioides glacieisoli TaxID=1168730 RepID=A0A4Q2RL59_9ACTN|nr:hypothetical protein [Nocardioides glacieisoli]RYB89056.1 hypothetical protein EUA06_18315 [Nocardioides glacieisoli]
MRITMLGGHASGKTSYLGALWATVRGAAPDAPVTLSEGRLPDSSTYLDECEHALLAGESVERTKLDHGERIDLDLTIDGSPVLVTHLDVAGETYEAALEQRSVAPTLLTELAQTEAVMLFVHPRRLRLPHSITDARRLIAVAGEPLEQHSQAEPESEPNDIDPVDVWKHAPTAVHLVEMLQLVVEQRTSGRRLNVALIVSAWDTIDQGPEWGTDCQPGPWVQANLPLLHQFLTTNDGHIRWKVFGVSAQGCNFDDKDAVDAIVEQPYDQRTIVALDGGWTRDIAEPLRWFVREWTEHPT